MTRCGYCKYFKDGGSRYKKGECTYYNNYVYADEEGCRHYR